MSCWDFLPVAAPTPRRDRARPPSAPPPPRPRDPASGDARAGLSQNVSQRTIASSGLCGRNRGGRSVPPACTYCAATFWVIRVGLRSPTGSWSRAPYTRVGLSGQWGGKEGRWGGTEDGGPLQLALARQGRAAYAGVLRVEKQPP